MNADFFIVICECKSSELWPGSTEVEEQPHLQLCAAEIIHHLRFMGSIKVLHRFQFQEYAVADYQIGFELPNVRASEIYGNRNLSLHA